MRAALSPGAQGVMMGTRMLVTGGFPVHPALRGVPVGGTEEDSPSTRGPAGEFRPDNGGRSRGEYPRDDNRRRCTGRYNRRQSGGGVMVSVEPVADIARDAVKRAER